MTLVQRSLGGAAFLCALACAVSLAPALVVAGSLGALLSALCSWQASVAVLLSGAMAGAFWLARAGQRRIAASSSSSGEPPIACTLSLGDMAARRNEIGALTREALISSHRGALSLDLTYNSAARERVEAMVAKERACCAFLRFVLERDVAGASLCVDGAGVILFGPRGA